MVRYPFVFETWRFRYFGIFYFVIFCFIVLVHVAMRGLYSIANNYSKLKVCRPYAYTRDSTVSPVVRMNGFGSVGTGFEAQVLLCIMISFVIQSFF